MFETLPKFTPDPILALIETFAADRREDKIDLGVGVYKNQFGETPIMGCVKHAEKLLSKKQSTKSYLGASGNVQFSTLLKARLLGNDLNEKIGNRVAAFQSVGGTGALSISADLLSKASSHGRVWIGTPTWPNHLAIFESAGLIIEKYVYCSPLSQNIDFEQVLQAAHRAVAGDIFLVHACCHNPTGMDLTSEQIDYLFDVLHDKKVLPLVDCAYAGFADGFEEDLSVVRKALDRFDDAIVCFSCSKNFGLYRERVGLILIKCGTSDRIGNLMLGLSTVARANYSMPPDHGAAVVYEVLNSEELNALWLTELAEIREEIIRKRTRLANYRMNTEVFKALPAQKGMFSLLPIPTETTLRLRHEFGVYMTNNARINVLGVSDFMEERLVESISRSLV